MSNLSQKNILLETGIRNINELSQRYDMAKIYFHMDTDGVTTAIAMKNYLERYGIKVVECEIIQYGDIEFSIKKPMAKGNIMPVLVDFAHGNPMFIVHTDHHDKQVGVEKGTSKQFRGARSNVETISQIVSPNDIFTHQDILMISTVDSADFARLGITPEQVMNYVFVLDKEKSLESNKIAMALVTNKLLLAYKNKPKFLEKLVMESSASLLSIYQNIVRLAKEEGYVSPEAMSQHAKNYSETMKNSKDVKYDPTTGIITQYGGGSMIKPGSYDRYVPFKNFPDANFIVLAWPLGLLQSSCNPFKTERTLKGVNLGEIAQTVLSKFESQLKEFTITIDTLKYFAEKHKSFNTESVGFTYNDLKAIYGENEYNKSIDGLDSSEKSDNIPLALVHLYDIMGIILKKNKYLLKSNKSDDIKNLVKKYNQIITLCMNSIKSVENGIPDGFMGVGGSTDIKQLYNKIKKVSLKLKDNWFNDLTNIDKKYKTILGGIIGLNSPPEGVAADYTVERWQNAIKTVMNKPYTELSERERKALKMLSISGWDVIQANSGGHKCITNISGLMYFGKEGNRFLKELQTEFETELKNKVLLSSKD